MGYHTRKIEKGVYGEISKIKEEVEELEDAHIQNNKIMILVELSDLFAAIDGYLENNFPGFSMNDISQMAMSTKSAFMDGSRSK